jgi:hypothetical protein
MSTRTSQVSEKSKLQPEHLERPRAEYLPKEKVYVGAHSNACGKLSSNAKPLIIISLPVACDLQA